MRKARVLISLLTALAMLFTFTLTAAAQSYSDVDKDAAYAQAVELLSEIKVFTGYEDGTFQPDGALTRQEFAAVVVRALNKAGVAAGLGGVGAGFTDDAQIGDWAMGYVVYAKDVGILDGYPDGSFKPQGNVTYAEAYKMLIVALGLEGNTDWGQNWPVPAMRIAGEIGLDKDITGAAAGVPMTRGDLAIATWNAVNSKYGLDKDGNLEAGGKDKSLLETHWPRVAERLKEDPRLAGIFDTYLSSSKRIRVDDELYSLDADFSVAINGWEDNGAADADDRVAFDISDVKKGDRVTLTLNAKGDVTYIAVSRVNLSGKDHVLAKNADLTVVKGETQYGTIKIDGDDYHVDNRTAVTVDGESASWADAKEAVAELAKEYGKDALAVFEIGTRGAGEAHASASKEIHQVAVYTTNTVSGKVTVAGEDTSGYYVRIDGGDKIYYSGFSAPAEDSNVVLLLDGRGVAVSNLTKPAPAPATDFFAKVLGYEGASGNYKGFSATLEKADGDTITLSGDNVGHDVIIANVGKIVLVDDGKAVALPGDDASGAIQNVTSTYIRVGGKNFPFASAGVFVLDTTGDTPKFIEAGDLRNGWDVEVYIVPGSDDVAGYIVVNGK